MYLFQHRLGPPSNVRSTNRSSHSLTFAWLKPECGKRNGPITNYSYTLTETMSNVTHSGSIPSQDEEDYTEMILDTLRPYSTYVFSVKAMNYGMSGVYEDIQNRTLRAGKFHQDKYPSLRKETEY